MGIAVVPPDLGPATSTICQGIQEESFLSMLEILGLQKSVLIVDYNVAETQL